MCWERGRGGGKKEGGRFRGRWGGLGVFVEGEGEEWGEGGGFWGGEGGWGRRTGIVVKSDRHASCEDPGRGAGGLHGGGGGGKGGGVGFGGHFF